MWMTSCTGSTRAEDLGDFEKVRELSWVLPREKTAGFCLLAESRPVALWWVPHVLGGRWKTQNRNNVYLSPYVEEPLNSKIKSFVPELRSRKCFSCFEIPICYIYIYIYMNIICPFHVAISWLCNNISSQPRYCFRLFPGWLYRCVLQSHCLHS